MIHLEEYRGVTIEDIITKTGLPNPYSDQRVYSLARQKELLLKDADRNNVLYKIEKTFPRKVYSKHISIDKDLTIVSLVDKGFEEKATTDLDLNSIPHKVRRELGKITITVLKGDIPSNVISRPSRDNNPSGYSYNVIGIFDQHKAYHDGRIYEGDRVVGLRYRFLDNYKNVSLEILD
jgi:hypothetical protein